MQILIFVMALLFGSPADTVKSEACTLASGELLNAKADVFSLDQPHLLAFWLETDNEAMIALTEARIRDRDAWAAAEAVCDLM